MKYEQRMMLALGLTLGILIFWSVLSPPQEPPPRKPPSPSMETQIAPRPPAPEKTDLAPERVERFQVGAASFGLGSKRGGIVDLELDGAQPLWNASPGLLELKWVDSSTSMPESEAKWDGRSLSSTASYGENGMRVLREISPSPELPQFLYNCRVVLINGSPDPVTRQLRMAVYRPVNIEDEKDNRYQAGIVWVGGKMQNLPKAPKQRKTYEGAPSWVTAQGKSHALIVQPATPTGEFHVEQAPKGAVTGWLDLPEVRLSPGGRQEWNFRLYAGPIDIEILKEIGLEGAISFGAFSGVAQWLLGFISWTYGWTHSYGLAICFLSFIVWLAISPVTFYGTRMSTETMQKMATVKPIEARIRKEHGKNPQKMQQELMQMYRKHGINPASGCLGCLPLLFTWPVFIALFQVLNRAPQLRGAKFLWIKDLAAPDALFQFPVALPLLGDSFNILPVLATAAMFVQQKSMQKTQSATMTDEQKMQQKIFQFLPLMLLVFFYTLPAGFMLYWVINSGLMAGQQVLVQRLLKKP